MPRFQYRAVDAGDHVVEASIEADDRDTALTRLRGEGLLPLRLDLIGYAGGKFRLTQLRRWLSHFDPDAKRLLPAAITVFVRELSMLLDASIGADRALLIIARSTEQSVLAQLATASARATVWRTHLTRTRFTSMRYSVPRFVPAKAAAR